MKFSKNVFVLVDGYTVGGLLAPFFNANGYDCIHIQSQKDVTPIYAATFVRSNFIDSILYEGRLDIILNKLSIYNVKAVIPSAESGVLLADMLNEALNITTSNGMLHSNARRNKYDMVQCLKTSNIPHAKSFHSNSLPDIIQWVQKNNLNKLVLKPLSSAGTYGVTVCNNLHEVGIAFDSILNQKNLFLETNTSVMVQEFLFGQEYIINTASWNGLHKVIDIWRKFKNIVDGAPVNDYSEMVSPLEDDYKILQEYVFKVLNSLGIKYGAGHSEVMMKEHSPILIETAARIIGSVDMSAATEALGDNQVYCVGRSYINPAHFLESYNKALVPTKYIRQVFFISPLDSKITRHPDLSFFSSLDSFHSTSFKLKKGESLTKTTTLVNSPGFCYLISSDKDQLKKDYLAIRNHESKFYHDLCSIPD
jgi:hypothetical protein